MGLDDQKAAGRPGLLVPRPVDGAEHDAVRAGVQVLAQHLVSQGDRLVRAEPEPLVEHTPDRATAQRPDPESEVGHGCTAAVAHAQPHAKDAVSAEDRTTQPGDRLDRVHPDAQSLGRLRVPGRVGRPVLQQVRTVARVVSRRKERRRRHPGGPSPAVHAVLGGGEPGRADVGGRERHGDVRARPAAGGIAQRGRRGRVAGDVPGREDPEPRGQRMGRIPGVDEGPGLQRPGHLADPGLATVGGVVDAGPRSPALTGVGEAQTHDDVAAELVRGRDDSPCRPAVAGGQNRRRSVHDAERGDPSVPGVDEVDRERDRHRRGRERESGARPGRTAVRRVHHDGG